MADETNEDDSWLYGSSENQNNEESTFSEESAKENKESELTQSAAFVEQSQTDQNESNFNERPPNEIDENGTATSMNGEDDKNNTDVEGNGDTYEDDEDESDDDVVVTIGDIKSGSNYNIKQRGNLLVQPNATTDKPKTMGKFSIEEFESVGTINGQSAIEYNVEAIEDKPWRKPGADITDYFNYGFNEDTWRAYCERQKKMRSHESGAGWIGMNTNAPPPQQITTPANRILTPITTPEAPPPAKENVIQVMTAERREYSRPKGKFDVSMSMPPPGFNVVNDPYYPEDNFSYGFEPTQEQQWNNDGPSVGWVPSGIKELTPGPQMLPPPPMNMNMPPPNALMPPNMINVGPQMVPPPQQQMPMISAQQIPMIPPLGHMIPNPRERNDREERSNNNSNDYREHDDKRNAWRTREKDREYRGRSRKSEERRDRERDRGSSRRERSRSRERSERRRRSKSRESARDKDRKSRDKKKSHKKDKDYSD